LGVSWVPGALRGSTIVRRLSFHAPASLCAVPKTPITVPPARETAQVWLRSHLRCKYTPSPGVCKNGYNRDMRCFLTSSPAREMQIYAVVKVIQRHTCYLPAHEVRS